MKGIFFILGLLLCFFSTTTAQPLTNDANTMLLLNFDNTVNGAAGEVPISSSNVSYAAGIHGNALSIASNTTLRFDTTQNFNTKSGTIEFWIKPETGLISAYIFDIRTTNGMFIEIGNFTSIYINTLPSNPNPQVNITNPGGNNYFPNTWYHLAFSWGNGILKFYLNGILKQTLNYNFELSPVPLTYFNIGSALNGTNQCRGLVDEFRISKTPRTDGEICQDYLLGWGMIQSVTSSVSSITMYKGWNTYLNTATGYQTPQITANNGTSNKIIGASCLDWSVSDPNILEIDYSTLTVKAKNAGSANLIGSINGKSVVIPVTVLLPVLPEEKVSIIDPYLTTPASCYTNLIKTVVFVYLPTLDGVNIDVNEVSNVPQTIALVKQRTLNTLKFTKFSLEEGSKFRGYQNSNAKPFTGYQVVEYHFIYEPLPRGYRTSTNIWFPDYNQIMTRFNGKKLVDTDGVKEVWLVGYHAGQIAPVESNMASRTTGDISNSNRFPDDMPIYDNTYILYNYNMERGGNEAVHNHGHQFESMLSYVATKQDGNSNLFWQNFVGRQGNNPPLGRCGDTHHPPNTTVDYDYCNNTLVASDIFDWKPSGGVTTMVNCNTWSSLPYTFPLGEAPDANSKFFVLWMQSFPGAGNQIPHGSRWMSNWWEFLSNWDSNTVKIGLHQSMPAANANGCTTTGIIERRNTNQLKLFPNPVKDQLYFAEQPIYCEYRVVNINGQVVLSGKGYNNNINIHQLQGGIYYLEIKEKEKLSVGRFYKQ